MSKTIKYIIDRGKGPLGPWLGGGGGGVGGGGKDPRGPPLNFHIIIFLTPLAFYMFRFVGPSPISHLSFFDYTKSMLTFEYICLIAPFGCMSMAPGRGHPVGYGV